VGPAGELVPGHGIDAEHPLIIDLDATLVDAHSPGFGQGAGGGDIQGFSALVVDLALEVSGTACDLAGCPGAADGPDELTGASRRRPVHFIAY
jgi:hypothetical protein